MICADHEAPEPVIGTPVESRQVEHRPFQGGEEMKLRSRVSYANVMSTLAFVIALSGGIAYGATYLVSKNSQVGPGVISGHKPPTGKHANIIAGSITGADVAPGSVGCVIFQGGPSGPDSCSLSASYPGTGVQCYTIHSLTPSGAVVSFDSGDAGYPVAFTSIDPTEITAAGCPSTANLVVTTYANAGGPLKNSTYIAIVD
jgi:hypothetical protein